jgi:hypothetical protein
MNQIPSVKETPWENVVLRYQLQFTKWFGPKCAYGVVDVYDYDAETIEVVARVRPVHQPIKGKTIEFVVDKKKAMSWVANAELYNFVGTP